MQLSDGAELVIRCLDLNGKPITTQPRVRVLDSSDPEHALGDLAPNSNCECVRRVLGKTTLAVGRSEAWEFFAIEGDKIQRDFCLEPNWSSSEYIQNPSNGHYYLAFVGSGQYSFAQAKKLAESAAYRGQQGHLVTITSEMEDDFLQANFGRRGPTWAGATDEGTEREWKWICGPEKGKTFSQIGESYTNWSRHANRNRRSEGRFLMWNSLGSWDCYNKEEVALYVIVEFSCNLRRQNGTGEN